MATKDAEHWSLDKKVPIAIIVTIVAQFAGFTWYSAKQDARLGTLEIGVERHEARLLGLENNRLILNDKVIRLEEQLKATYEIVRRIEGKIDIIMPPRRPSFDEPPDARP